MAEVRVSHLTFAVVAVSVVGFLIATCGLGIFAVGPFSKETADDLIASMRGYGPAKTPAEAMDKFREAIQAREYRIAARYCTKPYKDLLEKAHPGAREMGDIIDRIHGYAKDKGLVTDKLSFAMYQIDPFPRNFKSGPKPTEKGDKAYARFEWEPLAIQNKAIALDPEWKSMDTAMFTPVLAPAAAFGGTIELVKEGDAWKLNIPTNQLWETNVTYFNDNFRRYHTGLDSFKGDMLNNRYDSARAFESEVLTKLKNAKQ